jgi:hypothetical protein
VGNILQHLRCLSPAQPKPFSDEDMAANLLAAALHNYHMAKQGHLTKLAGFLDLSEDQQSFYLEWFIPRVVDAGWDSLWARLEGRRGE